MQIAIAVPCRAANIKMTPRCINQRKKGTKRSEPSDNVVENGEEIELLDIAVHTC